MKLKDLNANSNIDKVIEYLYERYENYLKPEVIKKEDIKS